mgnify:CR=1 FL=1
MKLILKITTVVFIFVLAFSSCSQGEFDNNSNLQDVYYVKYVIKCSQGLYYVNQFNVNTDKGYVYFRDNRSKYWTQTYGPVKKGFKAAATAQSVYPTIEIYVSKNNGPFALKTSNTNYDEVTASYTIDF